MLNMFTILARRRVWGTAIILVLLLTAACGPAPLGVGWPSVNLIDDACGGKDSLKIAVAFNDRVVLVNPADGKDAILLDAECNPRPPDSDGKSKIWDFRESGKQFYVAPLPIDQDNLLVIANDQHLFRVDLEAARGDSTTGTPIDGYTGHAVTELTAGEDLVYVGLSSKDMVALDKNTLDVKWTFSTEHGVWAKPLLVDNVLYVASLDHNLYAVNAETGEEIWKADLNGAVTAPPLYVDGKLYIGNFSRALYEISAADGQIIKQYATDDWVWGTPTLVDGTLYFADLGGSVYAVNPADFSLIWKRKVAEGAIRATPLVKDDIIVVASRDQKVYWINRADGTAINDGEGKPLVRSLESQVLSDILLLEPGDNLDIKEPIVVVGTLSTAQALVAFNLSNGANAWIYKYQ